MIRDVVPTGIDGLDEVMGGGFPRGGLIVIAGNPGTGKTVFSARFLYHGVVDYGEKGVYVSFAENRESFYKNMKAFGFDFERLEREGKFRYLEMLTVKEHSIAPVLKMIIEEVYRLNAKRLVVDSFSAMAQAFERPFDARIAAHTVLSRITRQKRCTTLMIVEVPFGEEKIGLSGEEFVADGILHFRARKLEERLFRDISIEKMRSIEIQENEVAFTIKDGFTAFSPFKAESVKKREKFKPLPDSPNKFSTGSKELDHLLDGGYPKGSTVLLEIGRNISTMQYHLILSPTAWNFLTKGAGVMVIPSPGVDYHIVLNRAAESGLSEERIRRLLRICILGTLTTPEKPCVVEFKGKNIENDYQQYLEVAHKLREKTGRPLLYIIGVDTLLANYRRDDVMRILNLSATTIREYGALSILLLKPGHLRVSDSLNAIADVHLKLVREHGALFLYGLMPRTKLHAVEMDVSKGYPLPKLTPVI